jgi:hypothetical protein
LTDIVETYSNKNAGENKTLTVSSYTLDDGNDGNNYNVVTVDNTTGTIEQAALTVTANNATWTIGTTEPTYSVSCDGLVADDTSAVLGTLNYTTTCTDASVAGQYEIVVSGPEETTNYAVSYVNGVLTVSGAVSGAVSTSGGPKYTGAVAMLSSAMSQPAVVETGDYGLSIVDQGINLDGLDLLYENSQQQTEAGGLNLEQSQISDGDSLQIIERQSNSSQQRKETE